MIKLTSIEKSYRHGLSQTFVLRRVNAEIKQGDNVAVLGFTFTGEKGAAILRAEYLFVSGKTYGLRSSPA